MADDDVRWRVTGYQEFEDEATGRMGGGVCRLVLRHDGTGRVDVDGRTRLLTAGSPEWTGIDRMFVDLFGEPDGRRESG